MLNRRGALPLLVLIVTLVTPAVTQAIPRATSAAPASAVVRVNQVGYAVGEPVVAYAMTRTAAPTATYAVVDEEGTVVASGAVGPDTGRWSDRWPHVYRVAAPPVREPGRYRLDLRGAATGTSPTFTVAEDGQLYAPLAVNGVRFFQAQRDGARQVRGVLARRPSHLADRRARTYEPPRLRGGRLAGELRATGRRVNVEGGWFDAGDYLKFVETASYADALLLVATRDASRPVPGLRAEALYGARWLDRVWLERSRTLVYQVGIGEGGRGLLGDHDVWRLPQADDRRRVGPGSPAYLLKHRPAFVTGARDQRISPNLAGRTAAAFALAAQVLAADNPQRARAYLAKARGVLARAKTRQVGRLLTTSPHSYYEEDEWRDDLELGAVEIALAGQALKVPLGRQRADLRRAAQWARAYLRSPRHGWYTLARDDQSALAHADLVRALDAHPDLRLAVTRADLTGDLAAQLRIARTRYADPLAFGGDEDPGADFAFGVAVTERRYRELTGDGSFAALGGSLRDWVLGANAWGTSLVIGAGSTFPRCPHHQIANILAARPGSDGTLLGAVSNGPAEAAAFRDLGRPGAYARRCAAGSGWAAFDGQGARYRDDARAYAATEPAIDYVAVSVLAFVLESGTAG
ncbi:glycoside hydrolase family 9 protein [Nocardioides sp. cx-169]|uniref:glycoside hydrolase family 9 protein n=1 Tax=Nocardioides sp. cx-169 TaxID=2899080 RepID=UPI001E60F110|nr:glycoside hydrolase family 9 protein [Nocardioides sp. cx-169]MCD4533684.1 glycoside hydrolase family 9 protein [Nocardioides sp. cx-169]